MNDPLRQSSSKLKKEPEHISSEQVSKLIQDVPKDKSIRLD